MGGVVMINDRAEFGQYCLRKLGYPVIRVNVSVDQVSDRIDEAISAWQEKHYDATEKQWIAYAITPQDKLNGYITMPSDILVVDQLLPMKTIFGNTTTDGQFSYQHQFMLQNMSPFQPLDMINYFITTTSLGEVNDLVNTVERFEYIRHRNRLVIFNTLKTMRDGEIICIHVHRKIDPDDTSLAWNDKWLKQYATALIKQQWGNNMKKHGEIQLLGGVTVNGQQIYDEASQELKDLEDALHETYEEPVSFFVG